MKTGQYVYHIVVLEFKQTNHAFLVALIQIRKASKRNWVAELILITEMIASCAPPAKEEVVEVAIPTPAEVTATAQGPVEGTEESPTTAGKAKGAPAAPAGKAAPAAPAAKEKA